MLLNNFLLAAFIGICTPTASLASTTLPRDAENKATNHHPTPINKRSAQEVISQLNLLPNPEKGYYTETFRDPTNITTTTTPLSNSTTRPASTAIYYLLEGSSGDSHWHRVDAVEVWHYYAGAPLTLSLARDDGTPVREVVLGPDVFDGQRPQVAINAWKWQRARSWGAWTLVGTTVAPGFGENGFELAEPGWMPNA